MTGNIKFDQIEPVDDLKGVIKDIFDIDLDIDGDWGYDHNRALEVKSLDIPVEQFLHMFATMRANIEMNLLLDEDKRYGGINATLIELKQFEIANKTYDVVTFQITAMNEKTYAKFIKEYKEGYGKKEFDISKHFKDREENTISIEVDYWFYGLKDAN